MALVALSLVACGEVMPVSLSGDAGVSLLPLDVSMVDAATSELPDASDTSSDVLGAAPTTDAAPIDAATTDAAPHVCSGVYPILFSCLADMSGCSPCVGGVTCCQLDAY